MGRHDKVNTVESLLKIFKCELSCQNNSHFVYQLFTLICISFFLQIKSKLFANTKFCTIFFSKHF